MDKIEQMIDKFVELAKLDDALFTREGVQADELEDAIAILIDKGDLEVQKALEKFK